jgi:hypothetical protein
MNHDHDDTEPWYKNSYVWLVLGIPSVAVIAGVVTLVIAIRTHDGLVVDDYYKRGLEINKVLTRDRIAESYDLKAHVAVSDEPGLIRVTLLANEAFSYPDDLKLTVAHATRGGFDQILPLTRISENVYEGPLRRLVRGGWYAQIEADDWRVMERIVVR